MSNILEQFFEEAISKFSNHTEELSASAHHIDYPENQGVMDESNHSVLPAEDFWQKETVFRKVAGADYRHPLSNDERALLDGAIRHIGIEAYAFYKSRRYISQYPFPGKWGVFYLEQGVARIIELIELAYPGYGGAQKLAYEFLREHERYHFKFDMYALSVEATLGKALYAPLKQAFFHSKIFQIEEALANRDVWDWARKGKIGLKEFAYDFMKLQPGAYARFDEKRFELAGELAANLLDLNLSPTARRTDQALWLGKVPDEFLRRSLCPEYFVIPTELTSWLNPAWKMPEVKEVLETKSFTKKLNKQESEIKSAWRRTRKKLLENANLVGLNFKPWKLTDQWSVRINDNFRAHLQPIIDSNGLWEAQDIGSHKEMGHG